MKHTNVKYVKRCLNQRCTRKEQCEHGMAMIRFQQLFPKGLEEIPPHLLNEFRAIYPCAPACPRWQWSREKCIEWQKSAGE